MPALLGQAQELSTYLGLPTLLLGHSQLGVPNHMFVAHYHIPAMTISINCLGMSNQARPGREVDKPKYWAVPGPLQSMQNIDREELSRP